MLDPRTSGRLTHIDPKLSLQIDECQWEAWVPAARAMTTLPLIDEALCGPPLTEVPLSESDSVTLAAVLAALADPVRLRLMSLLAAQGEVCSCHLEEPLGKSQPTISHHTRVLAQAGLIVGDRRGKWTWWRIVPERLASVREALGGT
jgi:ArsR family transcriptional regulator, arsenate/arsenite/antimonite-responsive transcriptional repressor